MGEGAHRPQLAAPLLPGRPAQREQTDCSDALRERRKRPGRPALREEPVLCDMEGEGEERLGQEDGEQEVGG